MADSVVIGKDALIRKFRGMGAALQGASLRRAAMMGGLVIRDAARDNLEDQGLIRTGTLSRSLYAEISEQATTQAVVSVGTNLEHAAIHEFGGTIKAKKSRYLAIPVGERTGSPLKYSDLKVRKTGGGTLVLVDPNGRLQYVLKASVEIPARPYLRPALDEKGERAKAKMGETFTQIVMKAATS
jgi:phage gpG-like protein